MGLLCSHGERIEVVAERVPLGCSVSVEQTRPHKGLADAGNLAFVSPQQVGNLLNPIATLLPSPARAQKLENLKVSGESGRVSGHHTTLRSC